MKIEIDEDSVDKLIIKKLQHIAESQLWHVNNEIQNMIKSKKKYDFEIEDLNDQFKVFEACNILLEYMGGAETLIKPVAFNAKPGCDKDGKKIKNDKAAVRL